MLCSRHIITCLVFIVTTVILAACSGGENGEEVSLGDGGSSEPIAPSAVNAKSDYTVSYSFQVFGGREGHGGFSKMQGSPQAGSNTLQVETSYPLKTLQIDVTSEIGETSHYELIQASYNTGDITTWQTDITVPGDPFTLTFTSEFEEYDTHVQETDTITPTTFSAAVQAEVSTLSPGEHTLLLSIGNKGSDTDFLITTSNNRSYISTLPASTFNIASNTTSEIPISLSIPADARIGQITINVVVTNTTTGIANPISVKYGVLSAGMPVYIGNPVMDILPGVCDNTITPTIDTTVTMVIVGSNKFDVTHINQATLKLNNTTSPMSLELTDVLSQSVSDCNVTGGDGIVDLVLTFASLDIEAFKTVTGIEKLPITVNFYYDDGIRYRGYDVIVVNP